MTSDPRQHVSTVPNLDDGSWSSLTADMRMHVLGNLGSLSMDYLVIEPGAIRTPVVHKTGSEILYIVSGELDLFLDGEMFKIRAGDGISIPPGMSHGSRNNSGERVIMIAANSPAFTLADEFETGEPLPDSAG